MNQRTSVIILAAGKGTRMKSDKAKVLHELNGRPMIHFVAETANKIAGDDVVVVIGHQKERVREAVLRAVKTRFAVQSEQKGTGHAVMCALPELTDDVQSTVILCGDVPLIEYQTIASLIKQHEDENCTITVLTVKVENPTGYGRIMLDSDGRVVKIIEEADADGEQKKIDLINAGIYCINVEFLKSALSQIRDNNAQGELYLTDIIEIAHMEHKRIGMSLCPSPDEVIGINTCDDLDKVQHLISCK